MRSLNSNPVDGGQIKLVRYADVKKSDPTPAIVSEETDSLALMSQLTIMNQSGSIRRSR